MSYILDALRKAEAERERGRVPGVHAQPAFGGVAPGLPVGDRSLGRWMVPLLGAIVVLIALLVWLLMRREPAAVAAAPSPSAAMTNTTPVAPTTPIATMPAPATPSPAPALAPARTPSLGPAPVPLPAPPVVAAAQSDAAALAARRARNPAPIAATNPPVAAAVKPPSTDNADTRVYAINDLPDDIRRALPALSVGGSVYSSVPANRILFLNGQVLHEGERLSPELALQQIRLKTAVMVFRGYRYELPF